MKKIFIVDSLYCGQLILLLQKVFENTAEIHCNPAKLRTGMKVDLFFISADTLLRGQIDAKSHKDKYGSNDATIVATDVGKSRNKLIMKNSSIDHFFDLWSIIEKAEFEFERLSTYQKQLLKSFLK